MFIDVNSIQVIVGSTTYNLKTYLLEAKYGYHKLWGDDTGRNLAGTFSGTFKGVYPKITLQFRKLNKQEIEYLAPMLDIMTLTKKHIEQWKLIQMTGS